MRFTAVCEMPSPWYMSSGIGTSAALRMRNVRSQRDDRSQTPAAGDGGDASGGRVRAAASMAQNLVS
jgi:hypothetical protein